jgi:hypothetical protein
MESLIYVDLFNNLRYIKFLNSDVLHRLTSPSGPSRRVATGLERHRRLAAGAHLPSASAFGCPEPGLSWTRNAPLSQGPLYGAPRRGTYGTENAGATTSRLRAERGVGRQARATLLSRKSTIHISEQRAIASQSGPTGVGQPLSGWTADAACTTHTATVTQHSTVSLAAGSGGPCFVIVPVQRRLCSSPAAQLGGQRPAPGDSARVARSLPRCQLDRGPRLAALRLGTKATREPIGPRVAQQGTRREGDGVTSSRRLSSSR